MFFGHSSVARETTTRDELPMPEVRPPLTRFQCSLFTVDKELTKQMWCLHKIKQILLSLHMTCRNVPLFSQYWRNIAVMFASSKHFQSRHKRCAVAYICCWLCTHSDLSAKHHKRLPCGWVGDIKWTNKQWMTLPRSTSSMEFTTP